MERQKLVRLVDGDDDLRVAVRAALAAGAPFDVWDDSRVPVSAAITLLQRRQAGAERRGRPLLQAAEGLEALRLYPGDTVLVGRVDDRQRSGMQFHLHLDPETEAIVCCVGVPGAR
ncbi:hypothetical protein GCM10022255_093900 [Dactylosporangium darangshiense]|uniref:Uncharacterized protein n=2 Tax=Dactylosporangium darangshiense TaxID=579108 RepID=A0ABP8DPY5_9ACTN